MNKEREREGKADDMGPREKGRHEKEITNADQGEGNETGGDEGATA